jgi:hypothetical protein
VRRRRDDVLGYVAYELHASILNKRGQMTAKTCRLFADHVLSSIISANVLHQFFLWSEIPIHVHVPWLCKHTGIFDRDLNLQAAEINTFVALDDMQLLCTRVCVAYQPRSLNPTVSMTSVSPSHFPIE